MELNKTIIFRADGNAKTGLGHLYRLFALVEMLKADYNFVFVTREDSNLEVIPEAYSIKLLPSNISINEEAQWLANRFDSNNYLIIADGYQFNSNYQLTVKNQGYKLVYIDDLVKEHMYADLVVNHSPQVKKEDFKCETYTKFALGLDYAILRPKFIKASKEKPVLKTIEDIFVNFGGSDSFGNTFKVTRALLEMKESFNIHIVVGAAFNDTKFFELEKENRDNIRVYKNLSEEKLINLMKTCSFAIVPSSTILFELFCVKMPIYSGYFVENQKDSFRSFKNNNLVYGKGNFNDLKISDLKEEIFNSINKTTHQKMLDKQAKLIDGLQQERHFSLLSKYISPQV
ncbi:MAG: UDP-2,4-diacetamido-2,4,6-trideoxy-beta-L-altropyranose hydrolase [Lacinutrix venerupis]